VVIERGVSDQASCLPKYKLGSGEALESSGAVELLVDCFLQLGDSRYFSEIDIEGLGFAKNNAPKRVFRHCLLKELAVMTVACNENGRQCATIWLCLSMPIAPIYGLFVAPLIPLHVRL
jgi:hypothetical protein